MAHPQSHPLQVNATTGEPYLRLPDPHNSIIITPPRMSDAPSIVKHLNDFEVYKWLQGPPYPYLDDHADDWLRKVKDASDAVRQELEEEDRENPDGPLKIVGACPVRILREVQADGTEVFLGDLGVDRSRFPGLESSKQARLAEQNAERDPGDPKIVWCIGDYLASSYHGRGIMSAAVGTLIREWIVPRMNGHLIRAEAFKGNIGSVRVFEKNGFVLEDTIEMVQVTSCGQRQEGLHILWWRK